ncbi:MAG: formate/nitrite transporter family protein [Candidatus Omnitrophica bacterium]|nr:formate/nitrite transporter family protein [Candidatus Omnitrophota bacterium]MCM8829645.1 formate/nitrite transporter family protein [Candidatus Omnitrophota bacterium]
MNKLFLTPQEISQELVRIGVKKAEAKGLELFLFGVLAGIYIGFGAQTAISVTSGGTLDPGLAKFLSGSVFSLGLMLVLIPGAELFTGNILMTIGTLTGRYNILKLLRNWLIVYAGNFFGSLFLAYLVNSTGLLGFGTDSFTPAGITAITIAENKMALGWTEALTRGVLCNILVCLAVILCISSLTVSGKIFGIYFPIMAFVASGYEHSIANMYFIPAGLFAEDGFISKFPLMWKNLIPVTIGNVIGGLVLVAFHPKMFKKILHH